MQGECVLFTGSIIQSRCLINAALIGQVEYGRHFLSRTKGEYDILRLWRCDLAG